jgi:microcystin-dependent protein
VTVDKGNFSVVLGEGAAEGSEARPTLNTVFNSATASDLFLGITVKGLGGNNNEIMPRLRLLTSPYSFLARTANSVTGSDGTSLIYSDASRLRISQPLQTTGGNTRGANAVDLQTVRSSTSPSQVASGQLSVIVGGQNNTASQYGSVVVGGQGNTASGWYSFIGGGDGNQAAGNYSTVPGGQNTEATGQYASALGRRAKARHDGSFVYGDGQDSDKASTGVNQFLVYAGGGMSINTSPASNTALTVSGKVKSDSADLGATSVTTLTASSTISGFGTVPLGGIIMWSGSTSTIPSGWALCDGTTSNGRQTPDLRGRFIVGAGQGTGLSNRNVGDTGGTETSTLTVNQIPAHTHSVIGNTQNAGSHNHEFKWYKAQFSYSGSWSDGSYRDRGQGTYSETSSVQNAGDHSHAINFTSGSAGSGESFNNLPPFYALAFIMRVQ